MEIRCVWEHNGGDSLIFAVDYPGAFTRGPSKDAAIEKLPAEIRSFLTWTGEYIKTPWEPVIVQEKESQLTIRDADSDVIFDGEKRKIEPAEYLRLKELAIRSARDFFTLYQSIPDKEKSCLPVRETFYGRAPRTAKEMYDHTKNVNGYYFGEIGVDADNEGTIVDCRERGFESLERRPDFLKNEVILGSYDEQWNLRKVLRRFIWHDRIHAKAMYRMAIRTFGDNAVPNVFFFEV